MVEKEIYEEIYLNKKQFSFGRNWQWFLAGLTEAMVDNATESLAEFLADVVNLKGKSLVDVGCGSGLSSLAACRLGASRVVSFDADVYAVECAKRLRERFGLAGAWSISRGSVLDRNFLSALGTFDVVYSWGVLHHTGDMWRSFDNVISLLKPGGCLYLSIYNNNEKYWLEGTSEFWRRGKRLYNRAPGRGKRIIEIVYKLYIMVGLVAHGRNPVSYVRNYYRSRGMSFSTDVRDWLGGYPYEFARPGQVVNFFAKRGFECVKKREVRSLGCNEFVFKRL